MRLPSSKLLLVAVLAVGTLGFVASQVIASAPTVKGKGKLFTAVNFASGSTVGGQFLVDIAEVPDNQTLVITDIVVCNQSGGAGTFEIFCNAIGQAPETSFGPVLVADDGTFAHSFGTGLECPELTEARVFIEAASAVNWSVSVTGYFRKGA